MHRTNIYLTEAQTRELDRLARQRGTSRADVVRSMIDRGLGVVDDDLANDLAAIEESAGVATEDVQARRGPDDRAERLEELWRTSA
jgi:predicted DNA-binding protein